MDRPYIICHMAMSLNGKVTGDFLEKSEYGKFIEDYYRIHREYGADAFLCGRVTMEGSFPQPSVTTQEYDGPPIAREDYIAEKASFYAVAIDPKGKLWWNGRAISDPDEGYNGAHIIEVLTESVPDAFLAHLRNKGVSYILGGKTELDLALVLKKLKDLFGIEKLLLEGGGIVNGSFLEEDLIDEISLVVIPAAECNENAIPLFKTGKYCAKTALAKTDRNCHFGNFAVLRRTDRNCHFGNFAVLRRNSVFPRTTTVSASCTTIPIRIFGQRRPCE